MAVRYLCYRQNPDETYVANPDGDLLDTLLDSRSPLTGVTINPGDPTHVQERADLRPRLSRRRASPGLLAVYELLEPNGFGMVFRLESDENGDPDTRLDIFRRQDGSPSSYKDLYLQPSGGFLDPSLTNLAQARLARDTAGVANVYTIESEPVRYEASFVLAPGFPIAAGDAADAAAIKAFDRSDPSFSQDQPGQVSALRLR